MVQQAEREAMLESDERHWWYQGMLAIECALLGDRLARRGQRFLDAGCGTGGMLRWALESGSFASVAGVLYVWWQGQIAPGDVYLGSTINLLVMAVVGGLVRVEGAWLGALAYIVIDNYVRDLSVPGLSFGGTLFGGSFNTIIGVIFLAIVVVSPDGLMGIWERIMRLIFRGPGSGSTEPTAQTQQPVTEGT